MPVDLTFQRMLTEELAREVSVDGGPYLRAIMGCLDRIETNVALIRSDKYVLFINNYAKEQIKKIGADPSEFEKSPCQFNDFACNMMGNCPMEECIKKRGVIIRHNINSPIESSNNVYDLVCIPISHNGDLFAIELWVDV